MSPAMAIVTAQRKEESLSENIQYQKGVKLLSENGLTKLPSKYVLPNSDRPSADKQRKKSVSDDRLQLPVIDFAELQGSRRSQVLRSLANACEKYGFFQLVNHGINGDVIRSMMEVSKRFFQLPFEERAKYMSSDMSSPVRYGTSFNQNKDQVFCWRDFLKLTCRPLSESLPHWPSSPADFRESAATYAEETRGLFLMLVEAIVESLGLERDDDDILKQVQDGSQLMVANCYPPCPEPDLTLGMPPHSDYGFLTLLLQDQVEGLQIHYHDKWVTVQPVADSFVINVGDHLEIFSNGRYKSVLHRVLVNSSKLRISIASLHSLPIKSVVQPAPKLIDEENPRRYKDTDFAAFLEYISSQEPKGKNFLESRKMTLDHTPK